MGIQPEHDIRIKHASAAEIEQHYSRWVELAGVGDSIVGGNGPSLSRAQRKNQLGIAVRPEFRIQLTRTMRRHGVARAIYARSVVLSADVEGQVIGGLVARPQRGYVDGVAPFGSEVQEATLVRLMKLEIVAIDREHRGAGGGGRPVRHALEIMKAGGVQLVYGSFSADRRLEPFYESLGFAIAGNGYGLDLGPVTGARFGVLAEVGERLFACSLGASPALVFTDASDGPVIR
ncbi:GNAT family N-acetyltransferase [Nocardia sp. XZ_19_385]|uniref:GNAT family N-acetyltransferase n=1 Tax=Nocardia sp. XZ_19_385 TaxID=2769488 RepID=UPI0018903B87|nr:GNAT family N-acetyltransferase [Nocardia sp. XZ_19_385]